jgi:hypothetical protein
MKILVLTLGDENFKDIMDVTSYNKKHYAWKHGYDFCEIRHSLDTKRPTSWSKILAIKAEFCSPVYDWIFWTDPDAVIMNSEIKLESIIDDKYDMVFPFNEDGLNAGNFLIKNSPISIHFLNNVYAQDQFINHPWWEQAAIHFLLHQYRSNMKLVPGYVMNSHPMIGDYIYKDGDFMIHFSGMGGFEFLGLGRLEALKDCVKKAK